jgi:hypothetical protein
MAQTILCKLAFQITEICGFLNLKYHPWETFYFEVHIKPSFVLFLMTSPSCAPYLGLRDKIQDTQLNLDFS